MNSHSPDKNYRCRYCGQDVGEVWITIHTPSGNKSILADDVVGISGAGNSSGYRFLLLQGGRVVSARGDLYELMGLIGERWVKASRNSFVRFDKAFNLVGNVKHGGTIEVPGHKVPVSKTGVSTIRRVLPHLFVRAAYPPRPKKSQKILPS